MPRRRPSDGLIDWSADARSVYDFIRALTRPYPGAFSFLNGNRYRIWKAALLLGTDTASSNPPGFAAGPVFSPCAEACGQVIVCGSGRIIILEVEDDAGTVLSGPDLSDQNWLGSRWDNGQQ